MQRSINKAAKQEIYYKRKRKTSILPTSFSNLWAWYDFSSINSLYQDSAGVTPVTLNNDPIGYVFDKSGNNRPLKQTGATNARPTYNTAIQNSLSSAKFDGDDYLDTTDTLTPELATVVVVCKTNLVNSTVYGILSVRNSVTGGFYLQQSSANVFRATRTPSTLNASSSAINPATTYIVLGTSNTTGATVYLNGNSGVTASAAYTGPTPQIVRLGAVNNNATTNLWTSHIFEVCIYSRVLTSTEITQLINYLNNKWSVY